MTPRYMLVNKKYKVLQINSVVTTCNK